MTPDDCTRGVISIGNENYYLIVGDDFVFCTVPRENDPVQGQERMIVEAVCEGISSIMEMRVRQAPSKEVTK